MSVEYEAVIGLEIHAQINTQTKMFCKCSNISFGKEPNINVCPICMGHPGQLPILNEEAVKKGIIAGLALNCSIPKMCKFDRKNYFYPDLPKGYQISQYDKPLATDGFIEIETDEGKKIIGIIRLHLEEDAGKLTHISSGTLCDYNRSSSPLMEIVSKPDLHSSKDANLYAKEIQNIIRYVNSSDADMEKGMMRFDINVSVRPKGETALGTRTEVKNLNSFKFLEKAIDYEIKRQIQVIQAGDKIVQETRGFDESTETTVSQRGKEDAHDYRYFPEPDLPPLYFKVSETEEFKKNIPELPAKRKERFINEFKLNVDDASILADDRHLGKFFEDTANESKEPKKAASLILSVLLGFIKRDNKNMGDIKITAQDLVYLISKFNSGELSNNAVKTVLEEIYLTGKDVDSIIAENNLAQVSDMAELEKVCENVVKSNEKSVLDFKSGKTNAFGFLVGQVMKASHGKANPSIVNEILKKILI